MAMSHGLMSDSDKGLPSPGLSARAAPKSVAPRRRASVTLRIDMLDLPGRTHAPAGDAVVVLVGERERVRHRRLGLAARRHEVGAQRLHVAGLVPGTALQNRG